MNKKRLFFPSSLIPLATSLLISSYWPALLRYHFDPEDSGLSGKDVACNVHQTITQISRFPCTFSKMSSSMGIYITARRAASRLGRFCGAGYTYSSPSGSYEGVSHNPRDLGLGPGIIPLSAASPLRRRGRPFPRRSAPWQRFAPPFLAHRKAGRAGLLTKGPGGSPGCCCGAKASCCCGAKYGSAARW